MLQEAGLQSGRECSHHGGSSGPGGAAETGLTSIHHRRLSYCMEVMFLQICRQKWLSKPNNSNSVRGELKKTRLQTLDSVDTEERLVQMTYNVAVSVGITACALLVTHRHCVIIQNCQFKAMKLEA